MGSGAIDVRYAVLLGGAMEFVGATSLGYGVSGTIQKGVSALQDPDCWACGDCDSLMSVYMVSRTSERGTRPQIAPGASASLSRMRCQGACKVVTDAANVVWLVLADVHV